MSNIINLPEKPKFTQKGLSGCQYHLKNKEVEIYFVDVSQGHDKYLISKKITHIYYILEGNVSFSDEEINKLTEFQEKFFKSKIVRKNE
jgi:hypothetical protein